MTVENKTDGKWTSLAYVCSQLIMGPAAIVGLVLVILLFVNGVKWYDEGPAKLIVSLLSFPLGLCLLVGILLAIPKRTRGVGGVFLVIASMLYLCSMWLQALTIAYVYGGKFWMVIGFLFAGIGVFAIALISTIVSGEFGTAGSILFSLILFAVPYLVGTAMAARADDVERISSKETPSSPDAFG